MKKFLSLFLLVLIFPLIFFSLVGLGFRQTFYKPEFVKSELIKFNVYESTYRNLDEIIKGITARSEKDQMSETSNFFTIEETTTLAKKILAPTELKQITEAAIDGAWPWFFNAAPAPVQNTSIAGIKQKAEAEILNFFKQKYEALPYCRTAAQFTGDIATATCRPRGVTFEMLKTEIESELGGALTFLPGVPENLNPEVIIQTDTKMQKTYNSLKPFQPIFASGRYLIFVWPALLLLAVFFLARLFAGAWSKTFTIAGAFFASIAAISYLVGLWFFSYVQVELAFWENKIPISTGITSQIISPFRMDLVQVTQNKFNLIMEILFILGVAIATTSVIILYFVTRQEQKSGWSLKEKRIKK